MEGAITYSSPVVHSHSNNSDATRTQRRRKRRSPEKKQVVTGIGEPKKVWEQQRLNKDIDLWWTWWKLGWQGWEPSSWWHTGGDIYPSLRLNLCLMDKYDIRPCPEVLYSTSWNCGQEQMFMIRRTAPSPDWWTTPGTALTSTFAWCNLLRQPHYGQKWCYLQHLQDRCSSQGWQFPGLNAWRRTAKGSDSNMRS